MGAWKSFSIFFEGAAITNNFCVGRQQALAFHNSILIKYSTINNNNDSTKQYNYKS